MQLNLEDNFVQSDKWRGLSDAARCALVGILQFATRKGCDWVVEGTPKQIGDWVGPEANMASEKIVAGLRELDLAGCIRRGRSGFETRYIVQAPVVER